MSPIEESLGDRLALTPEQRVAAFDAMFEDSAGNLKPGCVIQTGDLQMVEVAIRGTLVPGTVLVRRVSGPDSGDRAILRQTAEGDVAYCFDRTEPTQMNMHHFAERNGRLREQPATDLGRADYVRIDRMLSLGETRVLHPSADQTLERAAA